MTLGPFQADQPASVSSWISWSAPQLSSRDPPYSIPRAQAWAAKYDPSKASFPSPSAGSSSSSAPSSSRLLNLSQGVPGDPPHPDVLSALARTSSDPANAGYGGIAGEDSLRAAVAGECADVYRWSGWERNSGREEEEGKERVAVGEGQGEAGEVERAAQGVGVGPDNVMITGGANASYLATIMAICERGDEVIIPVPWYFNALMACQLLGVDVVPLPLDPAQGFAPSVEEAEKLVGEKTRAILLVTPNNPTGTTYSPQLIESFFELAHSRGIALILDETYRDFIELNSGAHSEQPPRSRGEPHTLFSRPDWQETLLSVFSFSKSYRIPGHRLGGLIAGQGAIEGVSKVLDCMQICAARPPQLALAPLLPALRPDLTASTAKLASRLALFADCLSTVPGWTVAASGAFYAYVRHPYEGVSSEEVSRRLAVDCGVVTLPGSFFMPEAGTSGQKALQEQGSALLEDRWIRFAVANVNDDAVRALPPRLLALNKSFGL